MNHDIPQYSDIGYTGTGYLIVRATTASQALPLEDATVSVYGDLPNFSSLVARMKTGNDGLTPKLALLTLPRSLSETPGNGVPPYATYRIAVSKPGFEPLEMYRVPIFDGITSIQPADLIPLPKNGYPDAFDPFAGRVVEGERLDELQGPPPS